MTTDLDLNSLDLEEAALHVLEGYPAIRVDPPPGAPARVTAEIDLLGDVPAVLSISASPEAAAALAVAFFGTSIADLSPIESVDAVKELANVIGGAIKPLFGVATTLSIPTTDVDEPGGADPSAGWVASAHIGYAAGIIELHLRTGYR
jgi:hypothetical protein